MSASRVFKGLGHLVALVAALVATGTAWGQATTIDALADRADREEAARRMPQGTSAASGKTARGSGNPEIKAIYGTGNTLRVDLIVGGKEMTGLVAGQQLPGGLKVEKVLPLEVTLAGSGKKFTLHFSSAPQFTESEEGQRRNASPADGRGSPVLILPPGTPPGRL